MQSRLLKVVALLLLVTLPAAASAGVRSNEAAKPQADTVRMAHVTISTLAEGSAYILTGAPALLKKRGIAAKWSTFNGSSPNLTAALLARQVDVGIIGVGTPINAVAQGGDLRIIAGNAGFAMNLVLAKDALSKTGGVTSKSKLGQRLKALKGLTIASTAVGTTPPSFLAYILQTVGVKLSDLKMVTVNDPLAMMEGMRNGRYDGAMLGPGSLEPALNDGSAVRWLSLPKDFPPVARIPLTAAVATGAWADSHRSVVARLRAAFGEAGSWGTRKRAGAKALIRKTYFQSMDPKVFDIAVTDSMPTWTHDGKISRTEFNRMMAVQRVGNPRGDFTSVTYEKLIDRVARK